MSDRPIEGLMDTTLDKIKQMVDVNTVIGTPITTPNGTTIIPISKVMYGFVSGGSEFNPKKDENRNLFGGGASAGVTINPIAFIAVTKDDVKLLSVSTFKNTQDRAVGMVPELVDKILSLFKKDKKEEAAPAEETAEELPLKETKESGIDDPKV